MGVMIDPVRHPPACKSLSCIFTAAFPHLIASPSLGAFTKFTTTAWGKKLAKQEAKAAMNDFDRFKATITKVGFARAGGEGWVQLNGCTRGDSRGGSRSEQEVLGTSQRASISVGAVPQSERSA